TMACRACLAGLLLFASMAWNTVCAHEGQDHDTPPSTAGTPGKPRLAIESEAYQIVAFLDGQRLTIYLDQFADNSPVTDATLSVAINGETVEAQATTEGTYVLTSTLFGGQKAVELLFDIKAKEGDDLL